LPEAVERLRNERIRNGRLEEESTGAPGDIRLLAACDPANPFGTRVRAGAAEHDAMAFFSVVPTDA